MKIDTQTKQFRYWLPNGKENPEEHTTEQNAVIIIGANGSGKSKLGAWMEQKMPGEIHRIGAQRKLSFAENIPLKNYSEAESLVLYGRANGSANDKMAYKWGNNQSTIRMVEDFDSVLAALIALSNKENKDFAIKCKNAGSDKTKWPDAPITAVDKLYVVWDKIFPQRKLKEDDSKFYAMFPNDNTSQRKYSGTQMSDGERAVLYMVAQVLCVPENKIMIIDEPEIHLHRSIVNRLWHTLETYRPDCLFIYITHDLQFAAAHGKVDKIWIKAFDGSKWTFEKIMDEELPEELTLEILGGRKNVLFVEGEKKQL